MKRLSIMTILITAFCLTLLAGCGDDKYEAYKSPYNPEVIRSDMAEWAKNLNGDSADAPEQDEEMNIWNAEYENEITASDNLNGRELKEKLQEYVESYASNKREEPISAFNVYITETEGDYTFYFLYK